MWEMKRWCRLWEGRKEGGGIEEQRSKYGKEWNEC